MKICFIAPLFRPWSLGGAEKYMEILVDEFSKNDDVFVITTQGPKPRKESDSNPKIRIIELTKTHPVDLHSLISESQSIRKTKKILWYLNDFWSLSVFNQVKSILKKEKPDIIHTNGFQGLSSSLFSAINKSNIPHVHTLHTFELFSHWAGMYRNGKPITKFNIFDRLYLTFMRKASSNIDIVISPSKFVMDFAQKNGFFYKSKKFVIPHGIDRTTKIKPKLQSSNEFLYFGRLDQPKGVQIAIEAFKKISSKEIKLHIAGSGPYENKLKNLAHNDQRIIFHGHLEKEQLQFYLNHCSYSIVPSILYETFGLVIIESLSHAMPVIASKIGAIPEIITNGYNGFLFEPKDSDSLSNIIKKTMGDHQLINKLSQNALDSSMNYPIESVFKSVREIYQSLIK
jgi:glycosyltransferase involved in cell wall biosynthesis